MDDDSPYDISVSGAADALPPIDAARVREAVTAVLQRQGCRQACISVALVDDASIATLNQKYLAHEGPTDVLSFNLSDEEEAELDGEIVLSWETAARQAAGRAHSSEAEVMLYVVHGTLHLVGLDDQQSADAAAMHAEEDRVLTELGFGAVYGDTQT
ncbi:MAG: rRNA maturation RNase YbeY [bacterium]|nr:rRNA maturation RNase YbeY [bacterium]